MSIFDSSTEQTEAPPARRGIFDSSAAPQEAQPGPFDALVTGIDALDESHLTALWQDEVPGLLKSHQDKITAAQALAQERADSDLDRATLDRVRQELDLARFGSIGQLRQFYDAAGPYERRAIQLSRKEITALWRDKPDSGYAGFVASLERDLNAARHSPELEQAQAELETFRFHLNRLAAATRRRLASGYFGSRSPVLEMVDRVAGRQQDRAGLVDTRSAHHRIFG